MELWKILLIVAASYLVVLFFYSLLIYLFVLSKFNKRADKNKLLYYFSAKDYPELVSEDFSFTNKNKILLKGKLYKAESATNEEIIIFFHGFGPGHEPYMTLIRDLAMKTKKPILAFDYTGCGASEGKKMYNTFQALSDGSDFLRFIRTNPLYARSKFILVGHSWGGFVAANLQPRHKDMRISKVVVLNGVTDFHGLYAHLSKAPGLFGPLAKLFDSFRYKSLAFVKTSKSIYETRVPHLFVHGAKDKAVPYVPFVTNLMAQEAENRRITFSISDNKFHNAYLTKESEEQLILLQTRLEQLAANRKDLSIEAQIKTTNFNELVENDEEIIQQVINFIKEK